MPDLKPNRLQAAICSCPRCGKRVIAQKFIINTGNTKPLITFACPECTDVVQVFVEGESETNSYIG